MTALRTDGCHRDGWVLRLPAAREGFNAGVMKQPTIYAATDGRGKRRRGDVEGTRAARHPLSDRAPGHRQWCGCQDARELVHVGCSVRRQLQGGVNVAADDLRGEASGKSHGRRIRRRAERQNLQRQRVRLWRIFPPTTLTATVRQCRGSRPETATAKSQTRTGAGPGGGTAWANLLRHRPGHRWWLFARPAVRRGSRVARPPNRIVNRAGRGGGPTCGVRDRRVAGRGRFLRLTRRLIRRRVGGLSGTTIVTGPGSGGGRTCGRSTSTAAKTDDVPGLTRRRSTAGVKVAARRTVGPTSSSSPVARRPHAPGGTTILDPRRVGGGKHLGVRTRM